MTNTVFMDPAVGGDGKTYTDGSDPNTGMDNGGHRVRFIPLISSVIGVANFVVTKAQEALAAAASAINAPGTSATCTTNITIPSSVPADISFTLVETGKAFVRGQTLCFAYGPDPVQQIVGVLMSFNPTTRIGQIKAQMAVGSGAHSDWVVSLAAPIDGTLTGRVVALENELVRLKSRGRLYARELR